MTAAEREEARGAGWAGQVRAARRAVSRAIVGKEVAEGDWEAVQRLMGGVMCRNAERSALGSFPIKGHWTPDD